MESILLLFKLREAALWRLIELIESLLAEGRLGGRHRVNDVGHLGFVAVDYVHTVVSNLLIL